MEALILLHYDLGRPILLQMDMSGLAIAAILNQCDVFLILGPINLDPSEVISSSTES